jgi:diguanylate cyclase (GGDEF)-like protein
VTHDDERAEADAAEAFMTRALHEAAHGQDLDSALAAILAAGLPVLGAGRGSITIGDRDGSASGRTEPIEVVAAEVTVDTDDAGPAVSADFPVLVSSGGVDDQLGTISFSWPERAFADAPTHLARAVADLAATTIDRFQLAALAAERADWLDRLAQTDALTGLANARTFARVLELELARAARQGSEVSIAIFDVDGLRGTNETAGRAAGDDVLRQVASVLAGSVRLVDTVARYGGDEFVVVAPGSAGVTVAQRVIDGVAGLGMVGGRAVSVSSGVARFPVDATTADGLLVAAERALDEARNGAGLAAAGEA